MAEGGWALLAQVMILRACLRAAAAVEAPAAGPWQCRLAGRVAAHWIFPLGGHSRLWVRSPRRYSMAIATGGVGRESGWRFQWARSLGQAVFLPEVEMETVRAAAAL